jgi:serine protease inhibitor
MQKCATCGINDGKNLCLWSKNVVYCGEKCQKDDWETHRQVCGWTREDKSHEGDINRFGLSMLERLCADRKNKNMLISPLSLSLAMAMLTEAAQKGSATREELEQWIDLDGDLKRMGDLNSVMPKGAGGIANAAWFRGEPNEQYKAIVANRYGAEIFNDISKDVINNWVSKNTNGMIKEIVKELSPLTVLVLVNALWFSCQWLSPFNKHSTIENGIFYAPEQIHCAMMRKFKDMKCSTIEDGSIAAVFLPLSTTNLTETTKKRKQNEASRLSFVIAIDQRGREQPPPSPRDISLLLDPKNMDEMEVDLSLPRTKLVMPLMSLKKSLGDLGIKRCTMPRGEFPLLDDPKHGIFAQVDGVFHSTVLEFDERGAKGAAATAVVITKTTASFPGQKKRTLRVVCDHPFFVGVIDTTTNVFVLCGHVYSPSDNK